MIYKNDYITNTNNINITNLFTLPLLIGFVICIMLNNMMLIINNINISISNTLLLLNSHKTNNTARRMK